MMVIYRIKEEWRKMDLVDGVIWLNIFLFITFFVFLLADRWNAAEIEVRATVIAKTSYPGGRYRVAVAGDINGMVSISEFDWIQTNPGDSVQVVEYFGWLSHSHLSNHAHRLP